MEFKKNQILYLPALAVQAELPVSEFRVDSWDQGGMGECIRVIQGNKSFALKLIRRDLVEDPIAWKRHLREMQLCTTLSACEGVVEAFCLTQINEIPVVCSRWMSGGNLRRHLTNRSPEFFFSVISRVVGTLAWIFEKHRIIHRDLKPDNILLDEDKLAFVSDWGIALSLATAKFTLADPAKPVEGIAHPALTKAGSFLGSYSYASPEQLLGEVLDHRTDIYSLGCLMYEWESGDCPFTGTKAEEIGLKHLLEIPKPLGSFFRSGAPA